MSWSMGLPVFGVALAVLAGAAPLAGQLGHHWTNLAVMMTAAAVLVVTVAGLACVLGDGRHDD